MSGLQMLLRIISGFMVLQPGSVLMSVVQVTIKDHLDVCGLSCSLVSH